MRAAKTAPAVTYRCDNPVGNRCLLLAVYVAPGPTHYVYAPAIRYTRNEAARQGIEQQRFPERAYNLKQLTFGDDVFAERVILGNEGVVGGDVVAGWVACLHLVAAIRVNVLVGDVRGGRVVRHLPDGHAELSIQRRGAPQN